MPDSSHVYWLVAAAAAAVALAFALPRFVGRAPGLPGTTVVLAVALPVLALAVAMALFPSGGDDEIPGPEAEGETYRARLVAHVASKPRDGRAWVALARLDMDADRFAEAAQHFAKAIEVSAKIARDPGVLCEYADALGMAQGGRLEGEPAAAVERALALDPSHPKALEMAGSAAYERGDFRKAVGHWRALLPHFPEGTAARTELAAAIDRAERRAALTLPPAAASRGG
ncbi:MAG: hypothetical protein OEX23_09160 [Betaproteobacteria bacterium]|nr:hypothetical protein [Betaproteobacteria bacterium]